MIENIVNNSKNLMIYAKDKNLKFSFCNETLAQAAGLDSPQQIIGKTDYDLVWRPQAKVYRNGNRDVLRGKILMNKRRLMTQCTKIVTLLCSAMITTDKNGYPDGVAGHSVDITGYTITKNNGQLDSQKNIFYLGPHFSNEYFTRREFEVFKYLLMGKSVAEIACKLARSIKTIQSQVRSIANKLQCKHQSEIVPAAVKYGLTYVLDDIHVVKN